MRWQDLTDRWIRTARSRIRPQGRLAPPLLIIMYHAVVRSPLRLWDWCFIPHRSFEDQLEWLKRACDVVPLSEVPRRLQAERSRRPVAAITFDDGFQNTYDLAFPILRRLELPATVFPVTGLIDTDDTIWYCRLDQALARTRLRVLAWRDLELDLGETQAKVKAAQLLKARLKLLRHRELQVETRDLSRALGDDPDAAIEPHSPFRMLSRAAAEEMAASPLIEFGGHTHSHAILSLLSASERRSEIADSLAAIEKLTGRPCRLFAYPNGAAGDYDTESIRLLQAAGVEAAVTTIEGGNHADTPVMELRRSGVGADCTPADFVRMIRSAA
jgi:peptidoglycan/xylan/chitin deacetylase (PgdA/CDA1 family)